MGSVRRVARGPHQIVDPPAAVAHPVPGLPTACEQRRDRLAISLRRSHQRARTGKLVHMLGHRDVIPQAMPAAPQTPQFTPAPSRPHRERASGGESAPQAQGERANSRFRIAHLALLGQGLAIGVLGGVAVAWSMANLRFGTEGMPLLGLAVTPLHGGLLLMGGALAVLACLGRWTTIGFSAIAAAGWAVLTVVCAVEASRHAPGVLGFDPRDTLLYGVLGVYNLLVCIWLAPTLWTKGSLRRH